jgi:hypothetical protein
LSAATVGTPVPQPSSSQLGAAAWGVRVRTRAASVGEASQDLQRGEDVGMTGRFCMVRRMITILI